MKKGRGHEAGDIAETIANRGCGAYRSGDSSPDHPQIPRRTPKEKSDTKRLPMMPIRNVVKFPFMMAPFVVGRQSSVRALPRATPL
jgi:hypothetical protein